MEKEKLKGRPSKKKPILIIVGLIIVAAICACIYPLIPKYNMTPFFRGIEVEQDKRFAAENEAENRILEYVTIGVSTREDVQRFIQEELLKGLPHETCHYESLRDWCFLPYSQVIFITDWSIYFTYTVDNILIEVQVRLFTAYL